MSALSPVDRLLIVQACVELIYRFADRNDARDWDVLADMFVEDGVFARPTAPDKPTIGREAIRTQFRARPAGKLTRHICSNTIVTVLSASEAAAHTTILLFTADMAEGAALPVKADIKHLLGAYDDKLVRDANGRWKFRERLGSLAMNIGG